MFRKYKRKCSIRWKTFNRYCLLNRNWIFNYLQIICIWKWFWEWQVIELLFWIRESKCHCPPRGLPRQTTYSSINILCKTGQLSIVRIQTLFHLCELYMPLINPFRICVTICWLMAPSISSKAMSTNSAFCSDL